MAYATIDQIQAEFKDVTWTSSTPISTGDVTQWLADADAEINTRISVKYLTPITGTESLVVMCMLCIWLTKDRILDVMAVKSGNVKLDQDGPKSYRDKAIDILADLASGKMKLTDATLATSADGVRSYNRDNAIPNVFDRTIDQW